MEFNENRLPSSTSETEWHWKLYVNDNFDLSKIRVSGISIDFNLPSDYFDLSDSNADNLSSIGRKYGFFSQPVSLIDFELSIFGNISTTTQIGALLENIKHLRPTADVYGLFAKYKYIEKSLYCAITVCFVDRDTGEEMETAVFEIGEDEAAYILPVSISKEALDYYSYDDLAKLVYWLGNFWIGVQYELYNCPEEIRIIEQPSSIAPQSEGSTYNKARTVLVRRIVPIDKNGNRIKYCATNSGRKYSVPVWGVRGHPRRLKDGRVTYVRPYPKGKERDNPAVLSEKEYKFVEDKIESDIKD